MRLNQFIARATGVSRRSADVLIADGQVRVNGEVARLGTLVSTSDEITVKGKPVTSSPIVTILLNKPVGYVVSRRGQGSRTVYNLLPPEYQTLKPIGRLDKDSSGLLLLTNDGQLAQKLAHPSFAKQKVYKVELDKPLLPNDKVVIEKGVELGDGLSRLLLEGQGKRWTITMHEGRNRQIRRTFAALSYQVTKLHRIQFGHCRLDSLRAGRYQAIESKPEQM